MAAVLSPPYLQNLKFDNSMQQNLSTNSCFLPLLLSMPVCIFRFMILYSHICKFIVHVEFMKSKLGLHNSGTRDMMKLLKKKKNLIIANTFD